ncbi:hypothetical protein MRX96_044453 [Rhipicephalus microplus]
MLNFLAANVAAGEHGAALIRFNCFNKRALTLTRKLYSREKVSVARLSRTGRVQSRVPKFFERLLRPLRLSAARAPRPVCADVHVHSTTDEGCECERVWR